MHAHASDLTYTFFLAQDDSENVFDAKTDKGSADLYFHYYGMLQHQQNMLQV